VVPPGTPNAKTVNGHQLILIRHTRAVRLVARKHTHIYSQTQIPSIH